MSETVIKVENLGKRYQLGRATSSGARYRTLRDTLAEGAQQIFRRRPDRNSAAEEFWALRDVNFEVKQGEVVGIIGRNGAGKSTLLKILSRITEPSTGCITIRGRVASLLEVGTGFHPELTGRENIFLNGAILGMSRHEIKARFDEIVAFAEIEKFLDTPVKRYSSGMYVRLAFSVAAHLEPEILVVDEVLAVGDAEFQKKCLGKMQAVSRGGRTVLFVSHNMAAITRLCSRAVVLSEGQIPLDGAVRDAVHRYLAANLDSPGERVWRDPNLAPGDEVARLHAVRILSEGRAITSLDIRRSVTVEIEFWNLKEGADLLSALSFFDEQETLMFVSADWHEKNWGSRPRAKGLYRARCTVPGNLFAEGLVRVLAEVSTRHPSYEIHILERDVVAFQVVETQQPGSVASGWGKALPGVVRPWLEWENDYLEVAPERYRSL